MKKLTATLGLVALGIGAAAMSVPEPIVAAEQGASTQNVTRRITAAQYRNIITDAFGGDIDLGGYFEPDLRAEGLLAVGASRVSISASGMEQYDAMSRAISAQVVDEKHRALLVPCKPAAETAPDDACARTFLGKTGRLLYRRPLTNSELDAYMLAARKGTEITKSFYNGAGLSLAAMLSSPTFLFREQVIESDPRRKGTKRLDGYAKASQLSFFLWNSGPDFALLTAAEKGDLHTPKGLARQVDRMLASPRLEAGVRAFFIDHLNFSAFETLSKDTALFPEFSAQVVADAQEQTLKTILDVVLVKQGDYRDVFTTKKTFITRELGAIYRVPVFNDGPNGAPDEWQPYEFEPTDPRGGILTQVSFTALHSPSGRGSATLRGKALREVLLCQKVPAPPGEVDFTGFERLASLGRSTARQRLAAHATDPVCAGCHKITDPMGLALETFDGQGAFRTTENGLPIDTAGEFNGLKYQDAAGLGRAIHADPAAASCLVDRMSSYALGQPASKVDKVWTQSLTKAFADKGYRVPDLMREIATSESLYRVTAE